MHLLQLKKVAATEAQKKNEQWVAEKCSSHWHLMGPKFPLPDFFGPYKLFLSESWTGEGKNESCCILCELRNDPKN